LVFTVSTVSRSVVFDFTEITRVRTPPSEDGADAGAARQAPGHEKATIRSQTHPKCRICSIRSLAAIPVPIGQGKNGQGKKAFISREKSAAGFPGQAEKETRGRKTSRDVS
jgi:hypothetical protein